MHKSIHIEILSNGTVLKDGVVATLSIQSNGYPQVAIKGVTKALHRWIAEQYIPNPEGHRDVDHIDGNPLNNDISNLRWLSHSDNIKRSGKMGKRVLDLEKAIAIILDDRDRFSIAKDYNINPSMVLHVKSGRCWKKAHQAIKA